MAQDLEEERLVFRFMNLATIKPMDESAIIILLKYGKILTIEEHQVAGGMGSAVAEVLARNPIADGIYRNWKTNSGAVECWMNF